MNLRFIIGGWNQQNGNAISPPSHLLLFFGDVMTADEASGRLPPASSRKSA
jgi:hypothetical protein